MATLIEYVDNQKDTTVVSFTGIGNKHVEIPSAEFKSLSLCYNMVYVIDDSRSWYNNIDVDLIISYIKKDQRVITIGNSMGAFNACCFTNDFPVEKCIMFATQYSIHSDVVPFETRWRGHARKIKTWNRLHLEFNDTTEYWVIQGSHPTETRHTDLIKEQPNIRKIFVPKAKHKVAQKLKNSGKLGSLITDIIDGNDVKM